MVLSLAYHYRAAAGDSAWVNYLEREALASGPGPVPHEDQRLPVITAQVEEMHARQRAGRLPADLDPALLRLLGFALVSYPACRRRSPG